MQISDTEREAGHLTSESLAEAIRTFNDVGMVVLEGVLDKAYMDRVRAAYDLELEKEIERRGGLEGIKNKTFGLNHVGFFPPMVSPFADESMAANPLAVQVAEAILGEDFQCDFYHTNTALPGSGIQPIHRDTGLLFGTEISVSVPCTALVVNIALCDFTVENGSTEFWTASHLIVDKMEEEGKHLEQRAKNLASIRTNMPAGSIALRDLRGWHRGMPNNADYPRTMFALIYKRGWLSHSVISVPQSTWEGWSERAKRVYRRNTTVPDAEHSPTTWEEIAKRR